jgi:CheY-like chemotaxis protein
MHCDETTPGGQALITLAQSSPSEPAPAPHIEFDSVAACFRWLQSFSRDHFGAVVRLESQSRQNLRLKVSRDDSSSTTQSSVTRLPIEMFGNNQRILLVEDEENVRFILAAMLRNLNYSVTSCGDGLEALEEVKSSAYDLVLVDAVIPRIAGIELIKRCREHNPSTRAVLMTAFRRGDTTEDGADEVLYKPFDMHSLAARIKRELPVSAETPTPALQ